jgi:hypothetical protein
MTPTKRTVLFLLGLVAVVLAISFSYSAAMDYLLRVVEHT